MSSEQRTGINCVATMDSNCTVSIANTGKNGLKNAINSGPFSISVGGKQLFVDTELKIVFGRRYGLVGPNGCGKTTLLKQMAYKRELKIPESLDILICEQEVLADETPIIDFLLKSDTKRNELESELETKEVCQDRVNQIYIELEAMGVDSAEPRARRVLAGLGFRTPESQNCSMKNLSGGWRMRVSLARALFMEPDLLLLDEPTNHLDLDAVIWLNSYLNKWKNTLVVVSHDRSFLDNVCTDIVHLHNRKLYYYGGNYSQFKEMRLQKDKAKLATPVRREYKVRFKFEDPGTARLGVLKMEDVSFRYSDSLPWVLGGPGKKGVNFSIDMPMKEKGVVSYSRIAILGSNGIGKSTFLDLLSGELEPTTGRVWVDRSIRVAKFDQHSGECLAQDRTPVGLLMGRSTLSYQEARKQLGSFGLPGHVHNIPCKMLSGGQKSRVALCEMALAAPHVLILDEPTNNLDLESIDALSSALNDYNGAVVVVTHDEYFILRTKCLLWVVEEGGVWEIDGEFDEYRSEVLAWCGKE